MEVIKDREYAGERPLFGSKGLKIENVTIHTGESALKECADIEAVNCRFEGKYPMWHIQGLRVDKCVFTEGARAALWYCKDVNISRSSIESPKALRELDGVTLRDCCIPEAVETFWQCRNIQLENVEVHHADYIFFHCRGLRINNYRQQGNYTFQYCSDIEISNANIDTKDAF